MEKGPRGLGSGLTELPNTIVAKQPRARGELRAAFDTRRTQTRLANLRQAGSLRGLFPRTAGAAPQLVLTNTSGGVTGGDRFRTDVSAQAGASVTVTTQAAERAYKAQPGQIGRVDTTLTIGDRSRINWVPQETILFDGCAFQRRLTVDLAPTGRALLVEPVVFGRSAMGELVKKGFFDDRIMVRTDGQPVFLDCTRLEGDIANQIARSASMQDGLASALVVFSDPRAEACLTPVRDMLMQTAGASLVQDNLLVARLIATDAFELRKVLMPLIALLLDDTLPRPWKL